MPAISKAPDSVHVAALVLAASAPFLVASCGSDEPIYGWVNEEGRTVYVNDPERIPPAHRGEAVQVIGDGPTEDGDVVYQYVHDGRSAYVNGLSRVPPEHRASATRVDLSEVSTNPELGREMDEAVNESWRALAASAPCAEARRDPEIAWPAIVWRDHGPLVVVGAALLLLAFATPWVLRRVDAPSWFRAIGFVVPVLLGIGLYSFVILEATRRAENLRSAVAPCDPEEWAKLPSSPDALPLRLGFVERMRAAVEAIDAEAGTRTSTRR